MAKLGVLASAFRLSLHSKVLIISIGFFSPFFLSCGVVVLLAFLAQICL